MKKYVCILGMVGAQAIVLAQDTTQLDQFQQLDSVFVDAKIVQDRKHSGKTVTVISQADLEANRGRSVAEVLNQVAGFEINGNFSNNGQNLGYLVRGGRNRQVLVVIDGVPISDPSQISNDFDLRLLSTDGIEKIEILKGASSVLYGSGAATAVISITTKKASNKPFLLQATTLAGTDRSAEDDDYSVASLRNSLNVGGTLSRFDYSMSVNHRYSDGLSAIEAQEGEAAYNADTFNAFNGKLDVGVRLWDKLRYSRFVSFERVTSGFDDFSYVDADNENESNQFRTGGNLKWTYSKGAIVINDSYTEIKREVRSAYPAKYDAKVLGFDTFWQHGFGNYLKTVVGFNGNYSRMNSFSIPFGETDFSQEVDEEQAKLHYLDPYVNAVFTTPIGLQLNAGVRLNMHSVYDNHLVYQLNPSYVMEFGSVSLKFMGSYSTAYITPSLYQLYDPLYGNDALEPEENQTLEGGLEVTMENGTRVSALYFQRTEEHFIDFVVVDPDLFLYQYQNISTNFDVSGIELEAELPILPVLMARANYTYTKRDDRFALRIPEHKGNLSLQYNRGDKTYVGLQFQYVSDREDSYFSPDTFQSESVTLNAYTVLNLNLRQKLNKNLNLLFTLDNLLNTDFEELYRYQTKGRSVQLGLQLTI